jgi:hypothetical protein
MNELKFPSENAFRVWLCQELKGCLPPQWIALKGKNVADIILSRQNFEKPLLIFLEVKYHKEKHGRIPIGSGSGRGYQPEYLLQKIDYLEKYLRWIVGEESTESCLLLTNEEVRNHAAGGIKEGKYNNLKMNIFKTKKTDLIPISEVPKRIVKWITEL